MFSRRACASLRARSSAAAAAAVHPPAHSRPFAAFAAAQSSSQTPALADITHDTAASFNKRQREFREGLEAARKKKEQQEKEAREREAQDGKSKKGGALSSLIYGTPEGRELDKDIERSFSQVLARGKYVHSIVFHEVKPDKVDEYTELVGQWYPKMASVPENKVHLVGSWRTEVGDCDTFVHIWEYQRYEGYHDSLHAIHHHPEYPDFERKLKTLITSKKTSLMQEFSFWPTTPPRDLGGLFELRSYTLHPGNLLEWETHWRRGLKARREVMEGVGAWFVQIGELNTVHHLWQFADLEERKIRREQSWGVEGWGETVHKTVPLIQTMKSRILVPCPWSPVA
ncbi:NIPSNAP-domain-containing protein [Aaosphaeria arxii CBS 175.79]|uniref:NIPSNAP-domain-containing protein n=1 Tax=Aaosphaeria arxii CBS 175.79 TaxID=1450172 RepID=A0A6A5XCJ9_9PLEO|nr:NIPSNAP-domain-containing protein [Aaosphaeria arxii CBS 175.79]KAF2010722.1 NIPSNAP-domain-containing protein [Aaosphaeria arxii CBS 175.79]